ncbi:LysR family transcriptional regulator [Neisseria wadsworthii]|uniref:LysR family transcriptional regulator n=1 Tax=Neisseria wadsworthii TaxID=607711 RepID=UPI0015F3E746
MKIGDSGRHHAGATAEENCRCCTQCPTYQSRTSYALRAFERAVHLESFTLAAQELHITQSAVSKHIKTLESHFGCLLFVRKGHKLTVTNHGKILARDLQSAFKLRRLMPVI